MFPDPRMPAKMQEAIEKLQQEAANAKREADKEEAIKILTQIMGAAFDKMSAYTSLIVIGGYAAFFSVWGVIEKFLPPWIKLTSFGFLTISILIFVLSETFRISTFTTEMQYFLRELRNATPAQIINRQKELAAEQNRRNVQRSIAQRRVFWATIASGTIAGVMVLYGIGDALWKQMREGRHRYEQTKTQSSVNSQLY